MGLLDKAFEILGDKHLPLLGAHTRLLPDLIDQLTPDGEVPRSGGGNLSALLDHFLGGYH